MPAEPSNITNTDERVQTIGKRILYVEPNDVYGTVNGVSITPDYTDLCISFDLRVETVPRTGYVSGTTEVVTDEEKNETSTYHIFWTSYNTDSKPEDNVVSFSKGEDYLDTSYLTTYYTDINLNDFTKSDIVEGLGVESVNISFESYYVPTIKIRFIDVRGASLFGRQEATHTDEGITQDSIWGCFFTFPYPKFTLQVKGFYGHPVTYQLTCTDFRANFNGKTGNFEIDVTFLGYDYGLLADIPTAYLLAAPYSRYVGMDYWEKQINSDDSSWKLTDGTKPEKLVEIMNKISTHMRGTWVNENGDVMEDKDDGANLIDKQKEYHDIEGLKQSYEKFVNSIFQKSVNELYSFVYNGRTYYMFNSQSGVFWNVISKNSASFYKNVNTFKKSHENDGKNLLVQKLIFGKETTEDDIIPSVVQTSSHSSYVTRESIVAIVKTFLSDKSEITIYTSKVKDIRKYINGSEKPIENWNGMGLVSPTGYQIIDCGETLSILNDMLNHYRAYEEVDANAAYAEQDETDKYMQRLDIYKAAGLVPTIENVFKTIMCHLETFMEIMYQCKTNIDAQITGNKRTPEKLGIAGNDFIDLKKTQDSNKDLNVPPWPAISVDEDKSGDGTATYDSVHTIGWVGDFNGETEWEETKVIEGLASAWVKIKDETVTSALSYGGNASIVCLPTDIVATVFPNASTGNPYTLGEYLGIRASAMFGVVGFDSNAAQALGKADALNFYSTVGKDWVKSNFIKWEGWQRIVKETPTKQKDEMPNYQGEYTKDPGCESPKMKILTSDGNKYRYTYTETVLGRTNENVNGSSKFGMVPVVEGVFTTVIGSQNTNAVFTCEDPMPVFRNNTYRYLTATINPADKGKTGRIYHNMSSKKYMSVNYTSENRIADSDYDNQTMFNIYGGGLMTSSYVNTLTDEYSNFDTGTLLVGKYEDTDTTWRKTLKQYWGMDGTVDKYYINNVDMTKKRFLLYVGDKTKSISTCVFNSPIYYGQNENRGYGEDIFERDAAKAILFLSTAGYDYEKCLNLFVDSKKTHVFEKVPYGAVLLIGGLLWRAEQVKDSINYDFPKCIYQPFPLWQTHTTLSTTNIDSKNGTPVGRLALRFKPLTNSSLVTDSKSITVSEINSDDFDLNVKNKLIKEFKHFVNNGWKQEIAPKYEWKNENEMDVAFTYNTFVQYYANTPESERQKFDDRFNEVLSSDLIKGIIDKDVVIARGTLNKQRDTSGVISFDKSLWESYADSFCSKLE